VGLETFGVHRIEPDSVTHSIVVGGIVRRWEEEMRDGEESGRRSRRGRGEGMVGGLEEGRGTGNPLVVMRRILERRETRIDLWTHTEASRDDDGDGDGEGSQPREYMKVQELRDTGYLKDLLRRCDPFGRRATAAEWEATMSEFREGLLPPRGAMRRGGERWESERELFKLSARLGAVDRVTQTLQR